MLKTYSDRFKETYHNISKSLIYHDSYFNSCLSISKSLILPLFQSHKHSTHNLSSSIPQSVHAITHFSFSSSTGVTSHTSSTPHIVAYHTLSTPHIVVSLFGCRRQPLPSRCRRQPLPNSISLLDH